MNLNLHHVDLVVLAAYLAAVLLLGVWIGRGHQDLTQYLLAGRQLPWWAILGSIVATETSTATFLSVPGIAYASRGGDLRFLQLAIGLIIGRAVIRVTLLPQYFRGDLFTAYEVLDRRFGGATKQTASLIFLAARNIGDGLRLFLTAIVLKMLLGAPLPLCVAMVGAATILYTFVGGMKSVVWNDCLQLVVYLLGGVAAGAAILHRLPGGVEQFWAFAREHDKLRVFDLQWNLAEPYTLWAGLVGGAFLSLGTHGTDQMMVQRYLCARSQQDAGRALLVSGFAVLLQFALFLLLGVALACFYDQFPPLQAFDRADQVFATFIVEQLPVGVGVIGLILAAVFAAAMSTLSSSLNSSAAAFVNDLYLPRCRQRPPAERLVRVSRICTILFGMLQIVIGIGGMYFATSVVNDVLAIAGFTTGLLVGVFALGVLTRRVGQRSALWGLLGGLGALLAVKFLTTTAWPWYTIVGASVTFSVGLIHHAEQHWRRAIKPPGAAREPPPR